MQKNRFLCCLEIVFAPKWPSGPTVQWEHDERAQKQQKKTPAPSGVSITRKSVDKTANKIVTSGTLERWLIRRTNGDSNTAEEAPQDTTSSSSHGSRTLVQAGIEDYFTSTRQDTPHERLQFAMAVSSMQDSEGDTSKPDDPDAPK